MKLRNVIFWTHLWVGIVVGVLVLIMSVTGMMLAYRPQIVAFAEQDMVKAGQMPDKTSPVRVTMKQIEGWHRWFGIQGDPNLKPIAHNIKTIATMLFLVMVVSGFYLWWPRTWQWPAIRSIVWFRPRLTDKARDWNRHNVIGLWCAPFLTVIAITGIIMCFPAPSREFHKQVQHIHTGEAGGIIGQTLAFLAAAGAVMLVWTGWAMAWRRFLARKQKT